MVSIAPGGGFRDVQEVVLDELHEIDVTHAALVARQPAVLAVLAPGLPLVGWGACVHRHVIAQPAPEGPAGFALKMAVNTVLPLSTLMIVSLVR